MNSLRAAVLAVALLAPARAFAQDWSWEGCRGGAGLTVSSVAMFACGQREVITLNAGWTVLEEGVREKAATLLSAAAPKILAISQEEDKLSGQARRDAAGAPPGWAECLQNAAEAMERISKRTLDIMKLEKNAVVWCREPLGDPDTERYAMQCGEKANDVYKGYQGTLALMQAVADRMGDTSSCVDADEDPAVTAQYQAVLEGYRSKQLELRERQPKNWCAELDPDACKVDLEPIEKYGVRLKHFAEALEPFPRDLVIDARRRETIVGPVKNAAAVFPRALAALEQAAEGNEKSLGLFDAVTAMGGVHLYIGIAYVKWKTWLCILNNIPMSVCYRRDPKPPGWTLPAAP